MQDAQPTIKSTNHKIHPCQNNRKIALIQAIIAKNEGKSIIVTTAKESSFLEDEIVYDNVTVCTDKTLILDKDMSCELLISYDLPTNPAIYLARLTHTTQSAILLLDKSEQNSLYPVETLLGRAIKQEVIEGYEEKVEEIKPKNPTGKKPLSKESIKEIAKKRYEDSTQEKKPKEEKEPSNYSKKDEKYSKKKTEEKSKYKKPKATKKGRTIKIPSR